MNFLAHLYLSFDQPGIMVGNLLADFIKGKPQLDNFSPEVQKGIQIHYKIDHFTDQHEVVKKSKQRLYEPYGKYAPVIVDIYYDHYLAKLWESYANVSLKTFAENAYTVLPEFKSEMPLKLQKQLPRMIAHNWLEKYAEIEGIHFVFQKMAERTRFKSPIAKAGHTLVEKYDEFEQDFQLFFPELIDFVKEELEKLS